MLTASLHPRTVVKRGLAVEAAGACLWLTRRSPPTP